jgi:hypothetical protein
MDRNVYVSAAEQRNGCNEQIAEAKMKVKPGMMLNMLPTDNGYSSKMYKVIDLYDYYVSVEDMNGLRTSFSWRDVMLACMAGGLHDGSVSM